MEKLLQIFDSVKSNFCDLINYKLRDNSIEIITPFSTLNDKFVSVFVKEINNNFIVSDGGWTHLNYYDIHINEQSESITKRVLTYYQQNFQVKSTTDNAGTLFYFKTCQNLQELSSVVFDMSNFISGAVNALGIQYKDEKEEQERETFRRDANTFLKTNYNDNLSAKKSLDDLKNIRFSAIIIRNSNLYLISYITGSTHQYFMNDLRKTIINFEISERSKYQSHIKEKISIINDMANGYHPEKSKSILDLLSEKINREPVKWTEKERILDII